MADDKQSVFEKNKIKNNLEKAYKTYKETGDVDTITNEVYYLYEKGFTQRELGTALEISESELPDVPRIDGEEMEKSKRVNETTLRADGVLGLPFRYDAVTDPNERVYKKTLFSDAPIVNIIPGKPQFAKSDTALQGVFKRASGDGHNLFEREIFNKFRMASDSSIEQFLKANAGSKTDFRYYGFRSAYPEFVKHLQILISAVGVKMGAISGVYSWNKHSFKQEFLSQGIKFYCLKSTSASESLDNSFGDSAIRDAINGISGLSREFQFLTGIGKGGEYEASDINPELAKEMAEMGNKTTVIDKLTGALKGGVGMVKNAALSGSNLNFPQVWKDSSFSRSYNLEFKFSSPYGHPKAIFEYVYLPFLVLMTLTMPKMDSLMGYYSPYLVRVDAPGIFTCDMGVITSMSWKRGGSDNLYTKDGLPLEMEVSITVQDLYPVLAMTHQYEVLRYNTGLNCFLENMAGMSVERFQPFLDIKHSLQQRVSLGRGYIDNAVNRGYEWANNVTRNVFNQNHGVK